MQRLTQRIAELERAVESAQLELASLRSEAAQQGQQGQQRAAVQRLDGGSVTAERVLEVADVNALVRHYSNLDEHTQAHEEWWGGADRSAFTLQRRRRRRGL